MKEDIRLLYIDLFCGAGGTSTGCENAVLDGRKIAKVVACVNHDPNAIASHKANHPDAIHYTEDIRTLDLAPMTRHVELARKTYPKAKLVLWASLECTNFSRAKGGMSRDADSRTLAEHLFRYVEALRPDIIQIENVDEFRTWGPLVEKRRRDGTPVLVKKSSGRGAARRTWTEPAMVPDPDRKGEYYDRWVGAMCAYGYRFESRNLNSADYGAYTSRNRFFGIFARPGITVSFPEPTHAKCPTADLFGRTLLRWNPVRDVLDLSDEGRSIFDRKKPLVDATLRRILAGLRKFAAEDGINASRFLTKAFGGNPSEKNAGIDAPCGTVTVKDHHQFITAYYGRGGAHGTSLPAPTITTKDRLSLVFIDNQYGAGVASSVNRPCGTLTVNPKQNVVEAKRFITNTYSFKSDGYSVDAPAPTVIARQDKAPLGMATAKYAGRLPSFITETGHGLEYAILDVDTAVMKEIKAFMAGHGIVDITMRMLRIRELKLIQGFPEDYILCGTAEEQKKYLGNAVVTVVAKAWCEALVESLFPEEFKKAA